MESDVIMEWHEWLMYGLVIALTVLRVLELFGVTFKLEFAKISIEVVKTGPDKIVLKFFPTGKKNISIVNFRITDSNKNALKPGGFTALLNKNENIKFTHKNENNKKLYIHFLFQKKNGKRVQRTRNISRLLNSDRKNKRLRLIMIRD